MDQCHIHMYEYFGGVARILVPDTAKLQLSIMVDLRTNMKPIRKWPNIMVPLLFRLVTCKKALSYAASPSYKSIKNILVTGSDKLASKTTDTQSTQHHKRCGLLLEVNTHMTNQSTIDKLIVMRLTAMADASRNQLDNPKCKGITFEDQFGMLVDIEYSSRKHNRLKRLIRRLATCEYISKHWNLFITGATGCGKIYMASTFGMEACKQYFNTKHVRLPDLLIDLEMARTDDSYKKVMAKYANPVVLILDEWLLLKPTDSEQRDIFELLH